MESIFTITDLRLILLAKLCFFAFLACSILLLYKRPKNGLFVLITGVFSGLAYYFLVKGTILPFFGLKGDEITIAAMYQTFTHIGMLSDFAYHALPPFYPPLFFQGFAFFGKMFSWNGVQTAKFASFITITFFPLLIYYVQKWFWQSRNSTNSSLPNTIFWTMSSVLFCVAVGWSAVIIKPYELVSAVLTILWTIGLVNDISEKTLTQKRIVWYGIIGGILFMLFYFWFFLAAIGVTLFHLFSRSRTAITTYFQYAIIAAIMLLTSAPFWFPLAKSYSHFGSENWQLGFFVIDWIATHGPFITNGVVGIILALGFVSIIFYRHTTICRVLLCLFVAGYMWQIMGMITIMLFSSPLQESKGFLFWNRSILVFGFAYGVQMVWKYAQQRITSIAWKKTVCIIGLCILATQLFFGTFLDDPEVQKVRVRAQTIRHGVPELIAFLQASPITKDASVLSSGIPELYAFLSLNNTMYFNQHNSHPAARFSDRLGFVRTLSYQKESRALYDILNTSAYKPTRFIFWKGVPEYYPLYFVLDNFPHKMKEMEVLLPRTLFTAPFFDMVYENNHFIVYDLNSL